MKAKAKWIKWEIKTITEVNGTLILNVETPYFTLLKLIPPISVQDPGITINIFDITEYTNTQTLTILKW